MSQTKVFPQPVRCCWGARRASRRGVTLFELLVAMVGGMIVILGVTLVDVGRLFQTRQVRQDAGFHTEGAYAMAHLVKRLEVADRINAISTSNLQFRVPLANDLDNPANYDWGQYRYDGATNQLLFYGQTEGGCPAAYELAANVTAFSIDYVDRAAAPPGGEPPVGPRDNNALTISLTTQDPDTSNSLVFRGDVTMRAGAYTNVMTGLSIVLPPPAAC